MTTIEPRREASVPEHPEKRMLVFNAGSSSLKFAVICPPNAALDRILSGAIDRIGQRDPELKITSRGQSAATSRWVGSVHDTDAAGTCHTQGEKE